MHEITIKFKDRNRSDLKVKSKEYPFNWGTGLVQVQVTCKNGISINKVFSTDIVEEITVVTREDGADESRKLS